MLLGSSGSGKSTLVNRLAGRWLMPTGDVRKDGRGRHTTRHRQLLVLPSGALLVDTPGLRELQVWEGDLDSAFADIAELADTCRFNDCAHDTEPDCAVQEALESGSLDPDRWASYLKLQRELGALRARRGSREHRELKGAGGRVPGKPGAPAATEASPEDYLSSFVIQYSVAGVGVTSNRALTA